MTETPPPARPPGIGDLLRRLVDDVLQLFRSELHLALGEVRGNIGATLGSLAFIGIGAMLLSVAMLCLLGAGVAWLAQSVGIVAAALIVAAVAGVIAALCIAVGVARLKATQIAPRRAFANLARDAETLKGD